MKQIFKNKKTIFLHLKQNTRSVSTFINKGSIGVFQCLQGLGQPVEGSEEFPDLLRQWNFYSRMNEAGANLIAKDRLVQKREDWVENSPNKLTPTKILNAYEVGKFCKQLREKVRKNAMEGNMTLTLGGCKR